MYFKRNSFTWVIQLNECLKKQMLSLKKALALKLDISSKKK